jgi:hypothetical protein
MVSIAFRRSPLHRPGSQPKLKMKTMRETVRLEEVVYYPTKREEMVTAELKKLPNVSLRHMRGYDQFTACCTRMAAAQQALRSAEKALQSAGIELQTSVKSAWASEEIPDTLKALFEFWAG